MRFFSLMSLLFLLACHQQNNRGAINQFNKQSTASYLNDESAPTWRYQFDKTATRFYEGHVQNHVDGLAFTGSGSFVTSYSQSITGQSSHAGGLLSFQDDSAVPVWDHNDQRPFSGLKVDASEDQGIIASLNFIEDPILQNKIVVKKFSANNTNVPDWQYTLSHGTAYPYASNIFIRNNKVIVFYLRKDLSVGAFADSWVSIFSLSSGSLLQEFPLTHTNFQGDILNNSVGAAGLAKISVNDNASEIFFATSNRFKTFSLLTGERTCLFLPPPDTNLPAVTGQLWGGAMSATNDLYAYARGSDLFIVEKDPGQGYGNNCQDHKLKHRIHLKLPGSENFCNNLVFSENGEKLGCAYNLLPDNLNDLNGDHLQAGLKVFNTQNGQETYSYLFESSLPDNHWAKFIRGSKDGSTFAVSINRMPQDPTQVSVGGDVPQIAVFRPEVSAVPIKEIYLNGDLYDLELSNDGTRLFEINHYENQDGIGTINRSEVNFYQIDEVSNPNPNPNPNPTPVPQAVIENLRYEEGKIKWNLQSAPSPSARGFAYLKKRVAGDELQCDDMPKARLLSGATEVMGLDRHFEYQDNSLIEGESYEIMLKPYRGFDQDDDGEVEIHVSETCSERLVFTVPITNPEPQPIDCPLGSIEAPSGESCVMTFDLDTTGAATAARTYLVSNTNYLAAHHTTTSNSLLTSSADAKVRETSFGWQIDRGMIAFDTSGLPNNIVPIQVKLVIADGSSNVGASSWGQIGVSLVDMPTNYNMGLNTSFGEVILRPINTTFSISGNNYYSTLSPLEVVLNNSNINVQGHTVFGVICADDVPIVPMAEFYCRFRIKKNAVNKLIVEFR